MSSRTWAHNAYQLVETDLIDDEAFATAKRRLEPLRAAIGRGQKLVPAFESMAHDIFAIFYKYNVVLRSEPREQILMRQVVRWVLAAPGLERSKETTRLQTDASGLAAALTLSSVLEMLRQRAWFNEDDLLGQWKLDMLGQQRDDLQDRLDVAEEIRDLIDASEHGEALEALQDRLTDERRDLEREIDRLSAEQRREIERLPARAEHLIKGQVSRVADKLERAETTAQSLGPGLGLEPNRASTAEKLTLGEKLLDNKRLSQLAELAGLFKTVARSARKRSLERRPQTVHSIERGRDLERLLGSELVLLRRPALKREFLRRYADAALAEYALEAPEPSGRGPLVVCIDGSGSMSGPREIWAKAIALTFMEIARRERRAFRAIVFSGSIAQARRFDLLESAHDRRLRPPAVDLRRVVNLAEYFPAGGTDFEHPMRMAVESLGESRFRHGDIVFITDGSANVSPAFLQWLEAEKTSLDFQVFSVLVDIGGSSDRSLHSFSDEVISVSELTAEELKPVFRRV